jgi:dTDP-4-dehydrorhamnose 3,5-epimerase
VALKCSQTAIAGVMVFTPDVFPDPRGFFMETYHEKKYRDLGLSRTFVQDNHSHSCRGTLRGLHYQCRHPQAKLVTVMRGKVFDVAVDIRRGSPTFGQWVGQVLSEENRLQMFVPEGFAHGFCVMSEAADVLYKCTDFYSSSDDRGIVWSDPAIGIKWPIPQPLLSDKDSRHPLLANVPPCDLPAFS